MAATVGAHGAGRDVKTGRFTHGNRQRETHGLSDAIRSGHSPDQEGCAALEARLLADLGGESKATTIQLVLVKQLANASGLANTLVEDHRKRGILTPRGRLRPTFTAFLQVLDRIDRLSQRLGSDQKPAPETPLSGYLARRS